MTPRLESDHPELDANTLDYVHFLADSPTPYHAAHLVAQRLETSVSRAKTKQRHGMQLPADT